MVFHPSPKTMWRLISSMRKVVCFPNPWRGNMFSSGSFLFFPSTCIFRSSISDEMPPRPPVLILHLNLRSFFVITKASLWGATSRAISSSEKRNSSILSEVQSFYLLYDGGWSGSMSHAGLTVFTTFSDKANVEEMYLLRIPLDPCLDEFASFRFLINSHGQRQCWINI